MPLLSTEELLKKMAPITRKINQHEHTLRHLEYLLQTEPSNKTFHIDIARVKRLLRLSQNKLKKLLHENIKT